MKKLWKSSLQNCIKKLELQYVPLSNNDNGNNNSNNNNNNNNSDNNSQQQQQQWKLPHLRYKQQRQQQQQQQQQQQLSQVYADNNSKIEENSVIVDEINVYGKRNMDDQQQYGNKRQKRNDYNVQQTTVVVNSNHPSCNFDNMSNFSANNILQVCLCVCVCVCVLQQHLRCLFVIFFLLFFFCARRVMSCAHLLCMCVFCV